MAQVDVTGYFEEVWPTSEGFKSNCPACGDTEKKFAWNTEKEVGCCFHSSCDWFYQHGGITVGRLKAWFTGRGIEHVVPVEIEKAEDADVSLPKEFKVVQDLQKTDRQNIYAYLRHRDLPNRIVDAAKVGYCTKGKYWGYIIFPVFDYEGNVAYWQGRRFKDREPKFWNPKSSKKSDLVYCVSKCQKPKTIILVESAINALTLESMQCGKTMVMALLGSSLSDTQYEHVMSYKRYMLELVIALDPDAYRKAVEIADRFRRVLSSVRIANVPEGEDINSLGREKAWELVRHAEVYDSKRRMEFMTREA